MALVEVEDEDEFDDLVREGFFKADAGGLYKPVDVMRGVIKFLRWKTTYVTTAELTKDFDVSTTTIAILEREGWIAKQAGSTKTKGNIWKRDDAIRGYIRYRKSEDRSLTKVAAESRVRDARAREIERRNAEAEGRLIEIEDAISTIDEMIGAFRSDLQGLPSRVTRDLGERQKIETAINDALDRLSKLATERGLAVAQDRAADEARAVPRTRPVGLQ